MRSHLTSAHYKAQSDLHWAERRLSNAAEDVSRLLARGCGVAELQVAEARLCAARAEAEEFRARLVDLPMAQLRRLEPLPRGGRSAAWAEAAESGQAPATPRVPSPWCTGSVPEIEQAFGDASNEAYRYAQDEEGRRELPLRAWRMVVDAWVVAKPKRLAARRAA